MRRARYALAISFGIAAACGGGDPSAPCIVTGVSVSPPTGSIPVGGSLALTAVVSQRDCASSLAVSWISSIPEVASVSSTGLVSGVAEGMAEITASTGGQSGNADITVTPQPVASIGLDRVTADLVAGTTVQLVATPRDGSGNALSGRSIEWTSSNTGVATVDGDGLVTAVSPGSAVITASCEGRSVQATVTVTPAPVASVTLSQTDVMLLTGSSLTLVATPRDALGNALTGRPVSWTSNRDDVATVDEMGKVTAAGAGAASITATSEGRTAQAAVVVESPPFIDIVGGTEHTCGRTPGNATLCWGRNLFGSLGDGTTTDRLTPTIVVGAPSFVELTAGSYHTCGRTSMNAVFCWGWNAEGNIGDGTNVDRTSPTAVSGGLQFVEIAGGIQHVCGRTAAGAAYCWGRNDYGEVGDGTLVDRSTPTPVGGGLAFVELTAGWNHTCGRIANGAAYCWGRNNEGQIGDGTPGMSRIQPTAVSGGHTFAQLSAGWNYSCGRTTANVLHCWGDNGGAALGDGTQVSRATPALVSGGLLFTDVSARGFHVCARATSGDTYCWGLGASGQTGSGGQPNFVFTPSLVSGGHAFVEIAAGGSHSCGRVAGNAVYCWGRNDRGQLGDGTTINRSVPTRIP